MTKTASLTAFAAALFLTGCGDDDSDAPGALKLRVAHLSPDASAVDVCLAPTGTGRYSGPVLEGAGGSAGLSFGQATRYLDVQAGVYDVRIVGATAPDCATRAVPDTTGVTLEAGDVVTLAATGLAGGAPGFALVPVVDDTQVAPGKAKVRFIHASPGTPPVDVGAGSSGSFTPLFTAVPFRAFDTDASATGYLEVLPLSGATLSARAAGTTDDALVLSGVTLPAGAIVTVFATGLLGGSPPLAALVCADDPAATSLLSSCTTIP